MAQTGQYSSSDVASAPQQSGQYSASDIAAAPQPKGFNDSFIDQVSDIVKGQVKSWLHGGGAVSSGGGDPRQTINETFNPFHPLETAGYLVPQPIKDIVSMLQQHNYGGAAGKGLALATQVPVPESAVSAVGDVGSAAVRGTAKAANIALDKAPGAIGAGIGAAVGHATGIPGAGTVGAAGGYALGKEFLPKITVPGEDFGLPSRNPFPPANGPQRAAQLANQPIVPPTSEASPVPSPAERQAYLGQIAAKRKAMGLQKPDQPTQAAPQELAPPSEEEVAKGMGFRSANQAQERMGSQMWRNTYQKIIGVPEKAGPPQSPTPSDLIDSILPASADRALNMRTKAQVNFYVEKGDVQGAKQAILNAADAAEDKSFQIANRTDLEKQGQMGRLQEGREFAAGSSMNHTKVAGETGPGERFDLRYSRYPLPAADMEANKMLGYDPRATAQTYKVTTPGAEYSPWGGIMDADLTAILQKSVDVAKRAKSAQNPR